VSSHLHAPQRDGLLLNGLNLLRIRPISALVQWRFFPAAFQAVALCAFVGLAVLGWGRYTPEAVNAKLYAKTNLVNLVIWGLWWPTIVWVTFVLGRAWCIVCPLELVFTQAEKLGSRLGVRQRPLHSWLARGGLILLFFALLQLLVPAVQLHRVPHYTSVFLWTALALALVVGLFLRDRAFCRGFCPVALLLNAYGRGGMLAVRPSGPDDCQSVTPRPNARACPSLLNPACLNTSKDCLVCGDCIKADQSGTMRLVLRPLYSKADAREPLASWPLTLFVMIASGFVTYELSGVWKAAGEVFLRAPARASASLGAGSTTGWLQGLWTIVVWPLAMWLAFGGITCLTRGAKSLGESWRRLALPMAVLVATGHMAKGLEKFTSWIGFLPHAWAEPGGVQTALRMSAGTMPQPQAWLGPPALSVLAMLLVGLGIWLALREAYLADPANARRRALPILLMGGLYLFLAFGWGGWVT
jgi:hypothetical protein